VRSGSCRAQLLTSNLRAGDHAPGGPAASFARTRNHMRVVGSVLVEYAEAVTVWLTVGEENVSWSSIWIVWDAARRRPSRR